MSLHEGQKTMISDATDPCFEDNFFSLWTPNSSKMDEDDNILDATFEPIIWSRNYEETTEQDIAIQEVTPKVVAENEIVEDLEKQPISSSKRPSVQERSLDDIQDCGVASNKISQEVTPKVVSENELGEALQKQPISSSKASVQEKNLHDIQNCGIESNKKVEKARTRRSSKKGKCVLLGGDILEIEDATDTKEDEEKKSMDSLLGFDWKNNLAGVASGPCKSGGKKSKRKGRKKTTAAGSAKASRPLPPPTEEGLKSNLDDAIEKGFGSKSKNLWDIDVSTCVSAETGVGSHGSTKSWPVTSTQKKLWSNEDKADRPRRRRSASAGPSYRRSYHTDFEAGVVQREDEIEKKEEGLSSSGRGRGRGRGRSRGKAPRRRSSSAGPSFRLCHSDFDQKEDFFQKQETVLSSSGRGRSKLKAPRRRSVSAGPAYRRDNVNNEVDKQDKKLPIDGFPVSTPRPSNPRSQSDRELISALLKSIQGEIEDDAVSEAKSTVTDHSKSGGRKLDRQGGSSKQLLRKKNSRRRLESILGMEYKIARIDADDVVSKSSIAKSTLTDSSESVGRGLSKQRSASTSSLSKTKSLRRLKLLETKSPGRNFQYITDQLGGQGLNGQGLSASPPVLRRTSLRRLKSLNQLSQSNAYDVASQARTTLTRQSSRRRADAFYKKYQSDADDALSEGNNIKSTVTEAFSDHHPKKGSVGNVDRKEENIPTDSSLVCSITPSTPQAHSDLLRALLRDILQDNIENGAFSEAKSADRSKSGGRKCDKPESSARQSLQKKSSRRRLESVVGMQYEISRSDADDDVSKLTDAKSTVTDSSKSVGRGLGKQRSASTSSLSKKNSLRRLKSLEGRIPDDTFSEGTTTKSTVTGSSESSGQGLNRRVSSASPAVSTKTSLRRLKSLDQISQSNTNDLDSEVHTTLTRQSSKRKTGAAKKKCQSDADGTVAEGKATKGTLTDAGESNGRGHNKERRRARSARSSKSSRSSRSSRLVRSSSSRKNSRRRLELELEVETTRSDVVSEDAGSSVNDSSKLGGWLREENQRSSVGLSSARATSRRRLESSDGRLRRHLSESDNDGVGQRHEKEECTKSGVSRTSSGRRSRSRKSSKSRSQSSKLQDDFKRTKNCLASLDDLDGCIFKLQNADQSQDESDFSSICDSQGSTKFWTSANSERTPRSRKNSERTPRSRKKSNSELKSSDKRNRNLLKDICSDRDDSTVDLPYDSDASSLCRSVSTHGSSLPAILPDLDRLICLDDEDDDLEACDTLLHHPNSKMLKKPALGGAAVRSQSTSSLGSLLTLFQDSDNCDTEELKDKEVCEVDLEAKRSHSTGNLGSLISLYRDSDDGDADEELTVETCSRSRDSSSMPRSHTSRRRKYQKDKLMKNMGLEAGITKSRRGGNLTAFILGSETDEEETEKLKKYVSDDDDDECTLSSEMSEGTKKLKSLMRRSKESSSADVKLSKLLDEPYYGDDVYDEDHGKEEKDDYIPRSLITPLNQSSDSDHSPLKPEQLFVAGMA